MVQNISAFAVVHVDYNSVAIWSRRARYTVLAMRDKWPQAMSHSIQDYFWNKDGLPDPNGALSSQLLSRAIQCVALANKKGASVLKQNDNSAKCQRGTYNR